MFNRLTGHIPNFYVFYVLEPLLLSNMLYIMLVNLRDKIKSRYINMHTKHSFLISFFSGEIGEFSEFPVSYGYMIKGWNVRSLFKCNTREKLWKVFMLSMMFITVVEHILNVFGGKFCSLWKLCIFVSCLQQHFHG